MRQEECFQPKITKVSKTAPTTHEVNSSHLIFHNSASESVITSEKKNKKTYRRVSINEETTTKERKAQNSTSPVFRTLSGDRLLLAELFLLIQSVFCRSDPIRSGPGFANGRFLGLGLAKLTILGYFQKGKTMTCNE